MKMDKRLSASGGFVLLIPHQELCPWSPLGPNFQTPIIGSRLAIVCLPYGKYWICPTLIGV